MNAYREENLRLKTMANKCLNNIEKKDRILQELLAKPNIPIQLGGQKQKSETHLISALRKQIKELKDISKTKNLEIGSIKKNQVITRLEELNIEYQIYEEESTRLEKMLNDVTKEKMGGYTEEEITMIQQKVYEQNLLIVNIKQENSQLTNALRKREEEANKWKEASESMQQKSAKRTNEYKDNARIKKLLAEKKKEVQKLKEQRSALKAEAKDKEAAAFQNKIDQLLRKQAELSEILLHREKLIQQLEYNKRGSQESSTKKEAEDLKNKLVECI